MRIKLSDSTFRRMLADLRALDLDRTRIGVIGDKFIANPGITAIFLVEYLCSRVFALERRVRVLERINYGRAEQEKTVGG